MPNGFGPQTRSTLWEATGAAASGAGLGFFQRRATVISPQQRQQFLLADLAVGVGGVAASTFMQDGPTADLLAGVGYGGIALGAEQLVNLAAPPTEARVRSIVPTNRAVARASTSNSNNYGRPVEI